MTRDQKIALVESLKDQFQNNNFFYLADASAMSVEDVNKLRGVLFEKGISMQVVKNTLVKKALESVGEDGRYEELYDTLKGPTALLFTDTANAPARAIEDFRENNPKPILKAAYIDTSVYIGDDKLAELAKLKSKEELLAEIIGLLQSPAKNLVSALNSGGQTIAGLVKALEERAGA